MIQNKPYIIGITGGIASGKSTVTKYLKSLGYEVIDFDYISREVLENRFVIREISMTFGDYVLDEDKVNRKRLGKLIFNDRYARQRLNEIMHPRIYMKANREIKKLHKEKIIFLDIPLLFESKNSYPKFYSQINETWVISSNKNIQRARLMLRDHINLDEAEDKIKSQLRLQLKEKLADVIIYNNGNLENLYSEVDGQLKNLLEGLK